MYEAKNHSSSGCPARFPEEMLSGHLDRELTQQEAQRVRLHLEGCGHCRALYQELSDLREAAMTTEFPVPSDDRWDELPRSAGSRFLRGAGWLLTVLWLVLVAGYAVWQWWTSPATLFERLVVFSGASGVLFLFLSILIDRLRSVRTDRYGRVLR